MHDLALRAVALAAFLGILAAGVYAAEGAFGGEREAAVQGVRIDNLAGARLAAPGTEAAFPLVVRNGQAHDLHVRLTGACAPGKACPGGALPVRFAPEELTVPAHGEAGAFATLDLRQASPAAAPVRVAVQAVEGERVVATASLPVTVRAGDGAAEGDALEVDYVGRFANGAVFDTSVPGVGDGPFGQPQGFEREYAPLRVVLGPGAGVIQGFWRALVGVGEGQSKTFTLEPAEAYGNATRTERVPRTLELPRDSDPLDRVQRVPRAVLAQYTNASLEAGQVLSLPDPSGNQRSYLVRELDAGNATIVWQVEVGDPFTLYPAWPGQSRAHRVTEAQVVFRTTPSANDTFTWYEFWPDATRVRSLNETAIVLEHSPAQGLEFDLPRRGGQALRARVAEVTPEAILVEAPNEHPLAGQALTFDVTVRALERQG